MRAGRSTVIPQHLFTHLEALRHAGGEFFRRTDDDTRLSAGDGVGARLHITRIGFKAAEALTTEGKGAEVGK